MITVGIMMTFLQIFSPNPSHAGTPPAATPSGSGVIKMMVLK